MNRTRAFVACSALLLTLACGGGGGGGGASAPAPTPATPATTLTYTDPPGGGYRLVGNAALSTPTKLVLDLVGPTGQGGQGVAFILQADSMKVSWTQPSDTSGLVQNLAFDLGSGPVALVGSVKGYGALHGAVFQKSGSISLGRPLLRVGLTLNSGAASAGTPIALTFTAGNGLSDGGSIAPISIATGGLVAR